MFDNLEMNIDSEPLKVSVLREELVKLTEDSNKAIVLNQFLYWSERTKSAAAFVKEEMKRLKEYTENGDTSVLSYLSEDLNQGWIYKSAEDMIEDTMLTVSKATMNRIIKSLIDSNWICKRKNPRYKGDNTPQYRVNLLQIQIDLYAIGYSLNGYKLIMNFVDLAKVEKLKEKINNDKTPEKPNSGALTQNESTLNQYESRSDQNDSTSTQNDFTSDQNDSTLPENTSKSTPEVLKKDDDEKYIKEGAHEKRNENDIAKDLLEMVTENPDFKNLFTTLRQFGIEPLEIYEILVYFKNNPQSFDKEVIKQQLTWMVEKSQTDVGISKFKTYFINGLEDKLKSKNISLEDIDAQLGIEKEELPYIPDFNWLNP